MESQDKLKETDIENRMCYHFDNIIGVMDRESDFDCSDIKEKFENILIYDISYKTSTNLKLLRIRFDKIDRFIKTNSGSRCLILFDYGWFDKICDRIK